MLTARMILVGLTISCAHRPPSSDPIELAARASSAEESPRFDCTSAREFVTAHNYLVDQEFGLTPAQMRFVSHDVAKGCSGSAKRFIRVNQLLVRAKLGSRQALDLARQYARDSDDATEVFLSVFKAAYLEAALDLDLYRSVQLADELADGFRGTSAKSRDDFSRLTMFCLAREGLVMPRPACAAFAVRLTKLGQEHDEPIADHFVDLVDFLRGSDGPQLTTADAKKIAESVVAVSPHAAKNFVAAYRFAASDDGLKFSRNSAVAFAQQVSAATASSSSEPNP